jgi:hypothetical protein
MVQKPRLPTVVDPPLMTERACQRSSAWSREIAASSAMQIV